METIYVIIFFDYYMTMYTDSRSDSALTYANIFKEPHFYCQNILPKLESVAEAYSDNIGRNIYIRDGKYIICDKGLIDVLSHYIYENVYALKRIAVEYDVPVIVVSSSSIVGVDYEADVVA